MNAVDEAPQIALLDLSGAEFNVMYVEEGQSLFVANNPLHWKLHKLQIAAARLEKQAERNPAQFNSATYIATIDKMSELMEQINLKQKANSSGQQRDAGEVAQNGDAGAAPTVGARNASALDTGISADNPFARQGSDSV